MGEREWTHGAVMGQLHRDALRTPAVHSFAARPNFGYGEAGAKAIEGDWKPTATVFRRLLDACLDES